MGVDEIALSRGYEQGLHAHPELAEGAAVVLTGLGLLVHRKHRRMERLIPVDSDR
jgi:hypothetical protein